MSTETERALIRKLDTMKAVCGTPSEGFDERNDPRLLLVERLSSEELELLRKLASGEIFAESKLRGRAINVLGFDRKDPDKSISCLKYIIMNKTDNRLRIKSLRAMARINREIAVQLSKKLLSDPNTNTSLSLAAARVSILYRKAEVAQELDNLRNRFIKIGIHENSQTIRTLRRMVKISLAGNDEKGYKGNSSGVR